MMIWNCPCRYFIDLQRLTFLNFQESRRCSSQFITRARYSEASRREKLIVQQTRPSRVCAIISVLPLLRKSPMYGEIIPDVGRSESLYPLSRYLSYSMSYT